MVLRRMKNRLDFVFAESLEQILIGQINRTQQLSLAKDRYAGIRFRDQSRFERADQPLFRL